MNDDNIIRSNQKRLIYLICFIIIVIILSITLFVIFKDYDTNNAASDGSIISDDVVIDLINTLNKEYYMENGKITISNIKLRYQMEDNKYIVKFRVTNNTEEVLNLYPKYSILFYNDDQLLYSNNGGIFKNLLSGKTEGVYTFFSEKSPSKIVIISKI